MKSTKKQIIIVFAILAMALVLSCAFVACNKTDTPDAPKKEFTITFDTQGGSEVKPITIAEGATITLPRNPTKEGYVFAGWYLSNALVEEFNITKTITGDITLYAKWIEDNGSEGLEYSLNSDGNGYTVTGIGTCTDKELIIPSEYKAKPVTSIGNKAFDGCSGLTSVTISNSVTSVGYEAFSRCTGLTSITIPDSVTIIDSSAFYNCTGLTSVTIGNSVTSIGDDAFYGCKGLTSVTIPDSVTSIAEGAFSGCSSIESIIIPFVGAKAGVTSSDTYQYPFGYIFGTSSYAGGVATEQYYYGSSTSSTTYKTYYIPSSLKSVTVTGGNILYGVFSYCTGLTSVTIGNGVTSIGKDAFYGCTGLTSITVAKGNTKYHSAGNCLIETGSKTVIAGCKNSIIPTDGSVTSIGDYAFYNCTGLTSVTIPHSVTSIGDYAFYGCKELTSITIPDSVTSIGYEAFSGCSSLESITIPFVGAKAGVTSSDTYQYPFGYIFGTSRYTGGVATEQYYYGYSTSSTISTTYYIPSSLKAVTVTGGNILAGAFSGCTGLTSITIPNSVTSIGEDAFYNTAWYNNQPDGLVYAGKVAYKYKGTMPSNTSIVLKEGTLGINAYAFVGCKGLTSVTIPDSVTSIGQYSFYGCTGLTSVTIGNSVTGIGYAAFGGCSSLESITIPFVGAKAGVTSSDTYQYPFGYIFGTSRYDGGVATKQYYYGSSTSSLTSYTYYIPSSLKAVTVTGGNILAGAFSGCTGLTSITIPNSVTSIGGSAFSGCTGLTSITIPNSVTSIGGSAFSGCTGLTNITIPDSVTSIGEYAFSNCKGLTSITIPDSVTSIGNGAFSGCTGLTSITIPNSVTSIGEVAFKGCTKLTRVTIPNSVTSIGDEAFYNCTGLTSVTIGNSVTRIGKSVFSFCNKLTSITIPDSVTSIGEYAFNGTAWYNNKPDGLVYAGKVAYKYKGTMPSNTSIVLRGGTLGIADSAFDNCKGLTSVTIPNSVTSIGKGAFWHCTGLTSVTIGNSVTSIGDNAFSYCTGLTSITVAEGNTKYHSAGNCLIETESKTLIVGCKNSIIPTDGSVTSIGKDAFYYCTGLTSITIPDSVTSIGEWAFYKCTGLTSITIPDSVTSIGSGTFYECTGLTSVTIGNSVTSIGSGTFSGCTGLTSVSIGNSVTSIGKNAFSGCTGLTSVTIPDSVTSIGDSAFRNCNSLTSVTIGNGVTSIGYSAFSDCGLTSVTIGGSVTSIGQFAFSGCGLTSVTIPDSVTSIGSDAFSGCYRLIEVYNKSTLSITAGSSSYGDIAYYAKNVYTNEGGSKLTTDENGYVIYTDGDEKILVAYHGTNTELILPSHITKINQYAFYNCKGLTRVTIPDSVTSIGSYAFYNTAWYNNQSDGLVYAGKVAYKYKGTMPSNTSIVLKEGTLGIADSAFYNCRGLTSITIPDSVTSIGSNAFYKCTGLTNITIGKGVTSIGYDAFLGCDKIQDIYITDIGAWCNISGLDNLMRYGASNKKLYINNELATSITIPNEVMAIPSYAFFKCTGLTNITIPDSVTSIGSWAFRGCTGLAKITGSSTVASTVAQQCGSKSFEVVITSGESIGSGTFSGCTGLTSVTIPDSVTSIGRSAFDGCKGLTNVTIPDSVTSIDYYAFYNCTGLTSIKFNGTKAQWNAISKGKYWKDRVPSSCKVICTDGTISI